MGTAFEVIKSSITTKRCLPQSSIFVAHSHRCHLIISARRFADFVDSGHHVTDDELLEHGQFEDSLPRDAAEVSDDDEPNRQLMNTPSSRANAANTNRAYLFRANDAPVASPELSGAGAISGLRSRRPARAPRDGSPSVSSPLLKSRSARGGPALVQTGGIVNGHSDHTDDDDDEPVREHNGEATLSDDSIETVPESEITSRYVQVVGGGR
jgi:hypothetical protein